MIFFKTSIVCVVLVALLLSSCTAISNIENHLPNFINKIDYQLQSNVAVVCIDFNPRDLWESGNTADELTQKMLWSFEAVIDDQIIPTDTVRFRGPSTSLPVYDENDKFLGTYPINFLACIHKSDLANVTHTAVIQMASISDTIYTYSWRFQFPEDFTFS